MAMDTKSKLMQKIQSKVGNSALHVTDMTFNLDEESRAKHPDLTDEQLFELMSEEEQERFVESAVLDLKRKTKKLITLKNQMKESNISTDYYEVFRDNPTEKTLKALHNDLVAECKSYFKMMPMPTLSYSKEDMQLLLNGYKFAYNVDYGFIKINDYLEIIHNNEVFPPSKAFAENVYKFKQDVREYENKFKEFQIQSKDIAEFEQKMNKYKQEYIKRNGYSLENFEQQIFKEKKELEGMYRNSSNAVKKVLENALQVKKAVKEFEDYMQVHGKTILAYCASFEPCFSSYKQIDEKIEFYQKAKDQFDKWQSDFLIVCDEQTNTKRLLKEVQANIDNYVKFSHEQNDGRNA